MKFKSWLMVTSSSFLERHDCMHHQKLEKNTSVFPEIQLPLLWPFSNSTITSSSEVQIMQTRTLSWRARKDLQLWYSDFLHLTSLRSPNRTRKVLLSWILRVARDLVRDWIGLEINLPYLHLPCTQAILSLWNHLG